MRPGRGQKIFSVFDKKSGFIQRLQVVDQIIGGNIFYSCSACIKNFTHPYLIFRTQYTGNFMYEIIAQKSGGSISMRLKPGNDLWCNRLTSLDSGCTFYRVVSKVIY